MMQIHAEGSFQTTRAAFVKVDTTWRKCSGVYVKAHGVWNCVLDNKIIIMPQRYVAEGVQDVCASAS